ncbi:hypothetical protein AB0H82_20330 [Streptomyces sp. NPDC050732]|uniref:hypothetical protein n=1 Tax=Streptomyces sp. NPDC050732 TaxID=3154632 RepID=UPI0034418FE6
MADGTGTGTALFPPDARDKLTLRLQNAVNGFVDEPRVAVESADRVLEETIADLTRTLEERRRTLRTTWQSLPPQGAPGQDAPRQGAPGEPAPATIDAAPPATARPRTGDTATGGTATGNTATGNTATGDTEQLRLALRDYRETAERLLRL